MLPEINLPGNERTEFKQDDTRKFKGIRLPGSTMWRIESVSGEIAIQQYENPFWQISFRVIRFIKKTTFQFKEEKKVLRLEAVLTGELRTRVSSGKKTKLRAGQYHLTDSTEFNVLFRKGSSCSYFVAHYSDVLLKQQGLTSDMLVSGPRLLSEAMNDLINEVLHSPYTEKLRDFHYENCIRELLFFHLINKDIRVPGEISNKDISVFQQVDSIISSDLEKHYSIRTLSKMAGTNESQLKKGFRRFFGMGLFERLVYRRMNHAKLLLETTDQPIGDISIEAGYNSAGAFITAFRKKFGMTPLEWREEKRGG